MYLFKDLLTNLTFYIFKFRTLFSILLQTAEHILVLVKVSSLTAWPRVVPPFHDYFLLRNLWKPQRDFHSLSIELFIFHEAIYFYCRYEAL